MSVLIDKNTKVICQGFTGSQGTFHSEQLTGVTHYVNPQPGAISSSKNQLVEPSLS